MDPIFPVSSSTTVDDVPAVSPPLTVNDVARADGPAPGASSSAIEPSPSIDVTLSNVAISVLSLQAGDPSLDVDTALTTTLLDADRNLVANGQLYTSDGVLVQEALSEALTSELTQPDLFAAQENRSISARNGVLANGNTTLANVLGSESLTAVTNPAITAEAASTVEFIAATNSLGVPAIPITNATAGTNPATSNAVQPLPGSIENTLNAQATEQAVLGSRGIEAGTAEVGGTAVGGTSPALAADQDLVGDGLAELDTETTGLTAATATEGTLTNGLTTATNAGGANAATATQDANAVTSGGAGTIAGQIAANQQLDPYQQAVMIAGLTSFGREASQAMVAVNGRDDVRPVTPVRPVEDVMAANARTSSSGSSMNTTA